MAAADSATHDEKVAMVYDELDTRKTRAVGPDAWQGLFRRLSFDFFSDATLEDLFRKADTNRDGAISFSEFQKLCDLYPTMLDCLYYRARDYWVDQHQQQRIEEAQSSLNDLRCRAAASRSAHAASCDDTKAQGHAVELAEKKVGDAAEREHAASMALSQAKLESSAAVQQLRDQAATANAAREEERQRLSLLQDSERETQRREQATQQAEAEVGKARVQLAELQRALQTQQKEVDAKDGLHRRAIDDGLAAKSQEETARAVHNDAVAATAAEVQRVAAKEHAAREAEERERGSAAQARDAAAETVRAQQGAAGERRDYAAAQEREQRCLADADRSEQACTEQQALLAEREGENAELQQRRARVQEEEKPLIENEIRLRAQRDCLENKEGELRQRFHSFSSSSRQGTQGRRGQSGGRAGEAASVGGAASPLPVRRDPVPSAAAAYYPPPAAAASAHRDWRSADVQRRY